MKCLFIGGSHAGKIIEVDTRRSWIAMPGRLSSAARLEHAFDAPVKDELVKHEIYRIDFATDKSGNRHALYVEENSGDPLILLMNFYAKADHS